MMIFLFGVGAFLASAALTPLTIFVCNRYHIYKTPREDRWKHNAIPALGGVAIFASFALVCGAYLLFADAWKMIPLLGSLAGASVMFGLGLVDDLYEIKPVVKLSWQIVASLIALSTITLVTPLPYMVAILVGLVWLVGITNAFNLLDNMDGLSSGVAIVSLVTLSGIGFLQGNTVVPTVALILAGSLGGFLLYNFHPAKIFMGDSGSLFMGFLLAALSTLGVHQGITNVFLTMLVPITMLAIPIFDTTLVSISRFLRGISISQGGKDHVSHRLVTLGLSQVRAVIFIYLLTALSGVACISYAFKNVILTFCLMFVIFSILVYLGKFLGSIPVSVHQDAKKSTLVVIPLLMEKKKIIEIFVDLGFLVMAYLLAFYFTSNGVMSAKAWLFFQNTLPFVLFVQMLCLVLFKVYRTVWEHYSFLNYLGLFKGLGLGFFVFISGMVFFPTRLWGSPLVPLLDCLLAIFFLSAIKTLGSAFKEYFVSKRKSGLHVLIYGAGDAGVLLLRETRNNPKLNMKIVGFIDDDLQKKGLLLHRVPILGSKADLSDLTQKFQVVRVVTAIPSRQNDAVQKMEKICQDLGLEHMVMGDIVKTL